VDISKENFFLKSAKLNIPKDQAEKFWASLETDEAAKSWALSKVIYYIGALIIISAMTWYMTVALEQFGGGEIFIISMIYILLFSLVGAKLWKQEDLKVPAGLLITIAVSVVPLAIYGLETYLNVWPNHSENHYRQFFHYAQSGWIIMDLGTIAAGVIALRFFDFPFLMAPVSVAAWFLTMDIIPMLTQEKATSDQKLWISTFFGVAYLIIAYVIDRKKKGDYAFWAYLFGAITFWVSLSGIVSSKGEIALFIYFLINLLMIALSIFLKRKILLVFGGVGAFAYIGHLAYEVFKDSILFPLILSFLGVAVIYLGILYQKWDRNRQ